MKRKKEHFSVFLEHFVDRSIPYCVFVLLGIILVEFFLHSLADRFYVLIETLDWLILTFFFVDLVFKWRHVHQVKPFLKKYWLDIIAVFPFFLFFRLFEELRVLLRLSSTEAKEAQLLFHEGVELDKAAKLVREGEELTKVTRSGRFLRFIKPVARLPRLVKAVQFFEHPGQRKSR